MINALFVPANPHRYPSVIQLEVDTAFELLNSPEVERLLGERPEMPTRTDRDAAVLVGQTSALRGESLNERATSWRHDHSEASRNFRGASAGEGIFAGNALMVGWLLEYGPEGPDYIPTDCPERIVSFAMSMDHDDVVDAHRARLRAMRDERVVDMIDPADRAADMSMEL